MKRSLTFLADAVMFAAHWLFVLCCWPYALWCLLAGGLFDWPTVRGIRELCAGDE